MANHYVITETDGLATACLHFLLLSFTMEHDFIKKSNNVLVEIFNDDGKKLFTFRTTGVSNLHEAVLQAYEASKLQQDIRLLVFRVTNETTDVSHRYRVNAHDNLHLIPEENP